jgi:hypothetical protein
VVAYQQKIHDHRDIIDAVLLLCDAEAPCAYRFLRGCVHRGGSVQLISSQSAFFFDFFPACGFTVSHQFLEALGEGLDKFAIESVLLTAAASSASEVKGFWTATAV